MILLVFKALIWLALGLGVKNYLERINGFKGLKNFDWLPSSIVVLLWPLFVFASTLESL